jgi:hypothetical protein
MALVILVGLAKCKEIATFIYFVAFGGLTQPEMLGYCHPSLERSSPFCLPS